MIITLVEHLYSVLFDLVRSLSQSEREKELEIGTRRIHVAACAVHPKAAWMMKQARQLVGKLA